MPGACVPKAHLKQLLWTEELQLVADLSEFDFVSPDLAPRGSLLALHVKGLAEKRPSVMRGDKVFVKRTDKATWYEGRAEHIEMEDVLLCLSPAFVSSYIRRLPVEVRFCLNRGVLKILHQGVDFAVRGGEKEQALGGLLFPRDVLDETLLSPPRIDASAQMRLQNPYIETNAPQLAAVRAVVRGVARHVPYVIYGPPGTGKTTTVVECMLQALKMPGSTRRADGTPRDGKFRVLACAPTNTAADLLCAQLAHGCIAGRARMLRLNAYSRARGEVGSDVLPFCVLAKDSSNWETPSLEILQTYDVVVATLSTAGKLTNHGLASGHFDLLVIDEAGQAQEPEALAPIASLWEPGVQLLLAGDPKQLGPVIHNSHAQTYGLAVSMLERLMGRALYARTDTARAMGMTAACSRSSCRITARTMCYCTCRISSSTRVSSLRARTVRSRHTAPNGTDCRRAARRYSSTASAERTSAKPTHRRGLTRMSASSCSTTCATCSLCAVVGLSRLQTSA